VTGVAGLFFYLFLFLFAALFFILLLPLTIRIKWSSLRENKGILLELNVSLFSRINIIALQKGVHPAGGKAGTLLSLLTENIARIGLPGAAGLLLRFSRSVKWKQCDLFIRAGTGDAAWAGIISGALHMLAGLLSRPLYERAFNKKCRPRLFVYPSFLKKELSFFGCIEFVSSGINIVSFMTAVLLSVLAAKNNGRCADNAGTSDTGLDDYSHGKLERNG